MKDPEQAFETFREQMQPTVQAFVERWAIPGQEAALALSLRDLFEKIVSEMLKVVEPQ